MELPQNVPAMSLPGVVLFPKTVMPLRIFEERYKEMLNDALATERVFAIANRISGDDPEAPSPLKVHDIATLGLIRMSSQNPDGTSILMLEGTERIHIDSIVQERPYPVLRISRLPTTNRPGGELEEELKLNLLEKIDRIHELITTSDSDAIEACHAIDDLEMLCHFIMQTYSSSPEMMQKTLEATDLIARCSIVSDYLELQIMLIEDSSSE